MLKVLFFASLRERLGCDEASVTLSESCTVGEVVDRLSRENPQWHDILCSSDWLVAVNQQMANREATVTDADELALFPPVTGG